MREAPERIWIQFSDEDGVPNIGEDATWCETAINDHDVEYVRVAGVAAFCSSCDGQGCPTCRDPLEDAMRRVRGQYGIGGIYDDFQGPEDALLQMAKWITEAGKADYRRALEEIADADLRRTKSGTLAMIAARALGRDTSPQCYICCHERPAPHNTNGGRMCEEHFYAAQRANAMWEEAQLRKVENG